MISTWHFALALAVGVYAYVLCPAPTGFALLTSAYVLFQIRRADRAS